MMSHTRSSVPPFAYSSLISLPYSYSHLLIRSSLCLFIVKILLTTRLLQLCVKLTLDKIDENLL
jgi:hypothetical protein